MARNCGDTTTDENGNKIDVNNIALHDDSGRQWQVGSARGRTPGRISWRKAQRMLRRGTAHAVVQLDGFGKVRMEGAGLLSKDHKVPGYRWGCPDVKVQDASGAWVSPTERERTNVADALLLSTISRVRADAGENREHARAVMEAAVSRTLSGSQILRSSVRLRDNMVVRKTLGDGLMRRGLSTLDGGKDAASALRSFRAALWVAETDSLGIEAPYAADAVLATYGNFTTLPEAEMLALGLVGDTEMRTYSTRQLAGRIRDERRRRSELREGLEDESATARGEEILAWERWAETGQIPPVTPGSPSDARVRFRDDMMMTPAGYELMPGLPQLVEAAERLADGENINPAARSQMARRVRGLLYEAEAGHPGALLWAAVHSDLPSLQTAAVDALPSQADLEYVVIKARPGTPAHERASASLRESLGGDVMEDAGGDFPQRALLTAGAEAQEAIKNHPELRTSPLFVRSALDATRDGLIVAARFSYLPGAQYAGMGVHELRKAALSHIPEVPEWLCEPDALAVTENLLGPRYELFQSKTEDGTPYLSEYGNEYDEVFDVGIGLGMPGKQLISDVDKARRTATHVIDAARMLGRGEIGAKTHLEQYLLDGVHGGMNLEIALSGGQGEVGKPMRAMTDHIRRAVLAGQPVPQDAWEYPRVHEMRTREQAEVALRSADAVLSKLAEFPREYDQYGDCPLDQVADVATSVAGQQTNEFIAAGVAAEIARLGREKGVGPGEVGARAEAESYLRAFRTAAVRSATRMALEEIGQQAEDLRTQARGALDRINAASVQTREQRERTAARARVGLPV